MRKKIIIAIALFLILGGLIWFLNYYKSYILNQKLQILEKKDDLFNVRHARPEVKRLEAIYQRLGITDKFHYEEHDGGHELDKSDQGIDFLCQHLETDRSANKPDGGGEKKPVRTTSSWPT